MDEAERAFRGSISITHDMTAKALELCKEHGFDVITAPFEADAQLAHLGVSGTVDAIVTEDSDLLVYGVVAQRTMPLLTKMDASGYCTVVKLDLQGIHNALKGEPSAHNSTPSPQLDESMSSDSPESVESFVDLTGRGERVGSQCSVGSSTAIPTSTVDVSPFVRNLAEFVGPEGPRMFSQMVCLCGNDYIDALPGVGISTAQKLVMRFRSISADNRVRSILRHLARKKKDKFTPEFIASYEAQALRAEAAFFYARVWSTEADDEAQANDPRPAGINAGAEGAAMGVAAPPSTAHDGGEGAVEGFEDPFNDLDDDLDLLMNEGGLLENLERKAIRRSRCLKAVKTCHFTHLTILRSEDLPRSSEKARCPALTEDHDISFLGKEEDLCVKEPEKDATMEARPSHASESLLSTVSSFDEGKIMEPSSFSHSSGGGSLVGSSSSARRAHPHAHRRKRASVDDVEENPGTKGTMKLMDLWGMSAAKPKAAPRSSIEPTRRSTFSKAPSPSATSLAIAEGGAATPASQERTPSSWRPAATPQALMLPQVTPRTGDLPSTESQRSGSGGSCESQPSPPNSRAATAIVIVDSDDDDVADNDDVVEVVQVKPANAFEMLRSGSKTQTATASKRKGGGGGKRKASTSSSATSAGSGGSHGKSKKQRGVITPVVSLRTFFSATPRSSS